MPYSIRPISARFLTVLIILTTLLAATTPAFAVDIRDNKPSDDPNKHEILRIESDFGPQTEKPFMVTLGDEIEYAARIQINQDDKPDIMDVDVNSCFEILELKINFLGEDYTVLDRLMIPEGAPNNQTIKLAGKLDNVYYLSVKYTVRAVATLSMGKNGMTNKITLKHDGDVKGTVYESTPVYTTALVINTIDTKIPEQTQVTSTTGNTVNTTPGMHAGQFIANAQFVLYADEACTRPVSFIESFRRYDVAPINNGNITTVIIAPDAPLSIIGLPQGVYYLQSIMPPDGQYGAPSDPIAVDVRLKGLSDLPYTETVSDYATAKLTSIGAEVTIDYAGLRQGWFQYSKSDLIRKAAPFIVLFAFFGAAVAYALFLRFKKPKAATESTETTETTVAAATEEGPQ